MAAKFGMNPGEVQTAATTMSEIRTQLDHEGASMERTLDVTSSTQVTEALKNFHQGSSDARGTLVKLLDRSNTMLTTLLGGEDHLDSELTKGIKAAEHGTGAAPGSGGAGTGKTN